MTFCSMSRTPRNLISSLTVDFPQPIGQNDGSLAKCRVYSTEIIVSQKPNLPFPRFSISDLHNQSYATNIQIRMAFEVDSGSIDP